MHRMEKACDIGVPVRVAYDQWTQFEEFPRFMDGVKEVRQLDDTHLHWHASVAGKDKEWDAVITEQVPDQVIAWRSTSGPHNEGEVRFEKLDDGHTRVRIAMVYEPDGALEKAGDAMGFLSRQVDKTVNDFKQYIEQQGHPSGAWRSPATSAIPPRATRSSTGS